MVRVPLLLGSRTQAADALSGGHHLPGGRLHARARTSRSRPPEDQPDRRHVDGAVLQRADGRMAAAQGKHVQVGPQSHLHAAQRRHLHHEPRRQLANQPGAPRLPQIQHILRRLGELSTFPSFGTEHAALFYVPAECPMSRTVLALGVLGRLQSLGVLNPADRKKDHTAQMDSLLETLHKHSKHI